MAKDKLEGFTEAERAAFEWSQKQRASQRLKSGRRSRSPERSHIKDSRRHRYDDSSDSDCPRDPFNPLKLAHQPKARSYRSKSPRDGRRPRRSHSPDSPNRWDHDLYDSVEGQAAEVARYQQQREEVKTTTYQVDTRRGSWRSRAGGVYLPPDDDHSPQRDLYTDYRPKRSQSPVRRSRRSRTYERPDPVYTLD
ncbi:uncharacterized protein BcabD6B2_36460 [Babesia caballi]|uniref:Uncharacterized protein n=1 Tax=Babesia caballi TaxID=5871 RepID=A0AAV4LYI4_BABCB|nr:hypothetical protein, conserved [Babesia caballi]